MEAKKYGTSKNRAQFAIQFRYNYSKILGLGLVHAATDGMRNGAIRKGVNRSRKLGVGSNQLTGVLENRGAVKLGKGYLRTFILS